MECGGGAGDWWGSFFSSWHFCCPAGSSNLQRKTERRRGGRGGGATSPRGGQEAGSLRGETWSWIFWGDMQSFNYINWSRLTTKCCVLFWIDSGQSLSFCSELSWAYFYFSECKTHIHFHSLRSKVWSTSLQAILLWNQFTMVNACCVAL